MEITVNDSARFDPAIRVSFAFFLGLAGKMNVKLATLIADYSLRTGLVQQAVQIVRPSCGYDAIGDA